MGYDILIGEAEPYFPSPDEMEYDREPRFKVNLRSHPDAPEFPGDDMTGKGNRRSPGYSAWSDFIVEVGLYDLFFGARSSERSPTRDTCLMRDHPGIAMLRPEDLVEIRQARERWEAKPWRAEERIPGWDPTLKLFEDREGDPRYDGYLARLLWLEWWIGWALDNCKVPAMYNH